MLPIFQPEHPVLCLVAGDNAQFSLSHLESFQIHTKYDDPEWL